MKLYTIIDFKPEPTDEWLATEVAQKLHSLAYNKAPGDSDGRKRVRGRKEMIYIYFYCDYRSEFHNYPDDQRDRESLEASGLGENYIASPELIAAIGVYTHLINTGNMVLGLLESARIAVNKLKNNFGRISIEIEETDGLDIVEKKMNIMGKLMDNLGKIPKVIKDMDSIEERVLKEESSHTRIQGGAEIGRQG